MKKLIKFFKDISFSAKLSHYLKELNRLSDGAISVPLSIESLDTLAPQLAEIIRSDASFHGFTFFMSSLIGKEIMMVGLLHWIGYDDVAQFGEAYPYFLVLTLFVFIVFTHF